MDPCISVSGTVDEVRKEADGDIESIKRFVQMGMGVAIVPRMCVQWEIEHG